MKNKKKSSRQRTKQKITLEINIFTNNFNVQDFQGIECYMVGTTTPRSPKRARTSGGCSVRMCAYSAAEL